MPSRCYRPVSAVHRSESTYSLTCPRCGAPAGFLCVSKTSQPQRTPHRRRSPVDRERLPDLRLWWRAMAPYEGQLAQPRPADLVVP
jgi:hypothetical protein